MNRRGFLSTLIGSAGAMVLDPEKLLWRPGAKLISIPAPRTVETISIMPIGCHLEKGDLFSIAGVYSFNPVARESSEKPQIFVVTGASEDGLYMDLRPATHDDMVNAPSITFQREMTKAEVARRYPDHSYFRRSHG